VSSASARQLGWDAAVALVVVAAVVLLQLPFRLRWVSLTDEGLIFQIADDLLHGHRLYSDAVHYAFPGIFYLTAAAFALFGTSFETARSLAIVLFAVTCGVAYLIARWWCTRRDALIVVVIFLLYRVWAYPHWQMLSYSSLAVTLALVGTWITGEGLAQENAWPFLVAGVMSAAAVLAKQDSGAMTLGALGLAVLVLRPAGNARRARRVGAFIAGAGLTLGAAAIAIWRAGFAPDMIRQAILAPLYSAGHFEHVTRPALWPFFRQDAGIRRNVFSYLPSIVFELCWPAINTSVLYQRTAVLDAVLKLTYQLPWVVPLAVGVPAIARLRRHAGDVRAQREILLVLLALGFFAAFNRPQDWVHLLMLYPPTLLLGAALWNRLRPGRVLAGGAAVILAVAALMSVRLALEFRQLYSTPVRSARGVLYARPEQAAALGAVLDSIAATATDAPVAALPYHPLLNFLSARPGITRFYLVWPVERDANRDNEVVQRLEATPSTTVIYSPNQYPPFPRPSTYAPTLFGYLADHFAIERAIGGEPNGFTFLVLRPAAPPPGCVLLGAALAAATVTVEPPSGRPRGVSAEERPQLVGEALWPFQRVVRMSLVPEGRLAVSYAMRPAAGERFVTSFGINPDHDGDIYWPPVRFALAVRDAGGEHQVATGEFSAPHAEPWHEATVDLGPWVGQPIDIVLRVATAPGAALQTDVAGWGDPRIVGAAD